MHEQIQQAWAELHNSISPPEYSSVLTLGAYLLLGGILALYIRFLYRRCSQSPSDADSIARVFPLLTLVTTGVIVVVKSSLALSLGLVGALSIVRFRAAIKDPEELVYLFLCIAVGLALGASQPWLAIMLVAIATVFILGMYVSRRGRRTQNLLLTITGDAQQHFSDDSGGVMTVLDELAGKYSLQRFDMENGRAQVRLVLSRSSAQETARLMTRLRQRLPDCDLSYVNMDSVL